MFDVNVYAILFFKLSNIILPSSIPIILNKTFIKSCSDASLIISVKIPQQIIRKKTYN